MVGSLGTEPYVAVGVVNQILMVFNLTVFGGLSGVSIFGSQFAGKGDESGMRQSFRTKIYFGMIVIVLGVGVGGFFDKVAYLAKHALLRPIDQPNPDPFYAQLEAELKQAINDLGIGPQGFGGKTTCLGVSIEAAPTHVASLPVAVNMSCHVTRRASASL
jgi:hypothetical protein